MKPILPGLALAVTLAGGALAAATASVHLPPAVAPRDANAWLHEIYDRYIGPVDKTRWIDYSNERAMRYYFEPDLVAMMNRDYAAAAKADEVPTLDGDPFIDAQDWGIKSFDIRVTPGADSGHASAVVKFDNQGQAKLLKLTLVRVGGAWKIHDIDYGGEEGTLRGMFQHH